MTGDPWQWSREHPARAALIFYGSGLAGMAVFGAGLWSASLPIACLGVIGGFVLGAYIGVIVMRRKGVAR